MLPIATVAWPVGMQTGLLGRQSTPSQGSPENFLSEEAAPFVLEGQVGFEQGIREMAVLPGT